MATDTPDGAVRAERLLALLGLARRAGKLAVGMTAAQRLVRSGACPLVVLATDAGAGLKTRVGRWEPVRGVEDGTLTAAQMAAALGRKELSVVAVADTGFVRGIEKLET